MTEAGNEKSTAEIVEPRVVVEEHVYESAKLKELGWSRTATRLRPLKGWFGLAQGSEVLTSKVDVEGSRRILDQVRKSEPPTSQAEEGQSNDQ